MQNVTIVINTLGRINKQVTYNNLPPSIRDMVLFSVQQQEYPQYLTAGFSTNQLLVLPTEITNLTATRQWLIENVLTRFLIIMDDDLTFFTRKEETGAKKLYKMTPAEHEQMFQDMLEFLEMYPMVGISSREGNQNEPLNVKLVGRSMRIFGLDLDVVRSNGFRFDRTKTKEDMDMTLQILRAGYRNAVFYQYANDHGSSNAAGGCSNYRTLELMKEDAHVLAGLHPGFVTVVEKSTKTSWNGMTRTDVRVAWKKAYESSQRKEA